MGGEPPAGLNLFPVPYRRPVNRSPAPPERPARAGRPGVARGSMDDRAKPGHERGGNGAIRAENAVAEAEYDALLRGDFAVFAERAFHTLYPRGEFLMNWHLRVVAARLAAVRLGHTRRLMINLPPRHLKSLLASIAFPAWVLGHEPSAEILCVTPGL